MDELMDRQRLSEVSSCRNPSEWLQNMALLKRRIRGWCYSSSWIG